MATISARIDDQLKARAEQIADSIGIPLSSVINVFLRRFVVEKGFPFEVKALDMTDMSLQPVYDSDLLEESVKRAVANSIGFSVPDHFAYFDPETQKPITVDNGKEP